MSTSAWLHELPDLEVGRPGWIGAQPPAAPVALLPVGPDEKARRRQVEDLAMPSPSAEREAAAEREAFARGHAAGERLGREAARVRSETMLARLDDTIAEIGALRTGILRRSAADVVRLAVAIAERVLRREIAADRAQLLAMAEAALHRLGNGALVTIALHPDDHAALSATGRRPSGPGPIQLAADQHLPAGGCQIQSQFGIIDVSIEAQIQEIRSALLDEDTNGSPDGSDADGQRRGD